MGSKIEIPKFSSKKPYDRYKVELEAWSLATETKKEKQGLVVALSLPEDDESQIRDKVFSEIDLSALNGEDGLDLLMGYLDKQFGKDDLTVTYEFYVDFDRCKRAGGQKVNDFILEFEKKYNILAKKDAKLPPVILAMKLIDSCGLTQIEKQLVLSGMDYGQKDALFVQAKASLRKFVGEQATADKMHSQPAVKVESLDGIDEEVLVAAGWQKTGSGFNKKSFRGWSDQRDGQRSDTGQGRNGYGQRYPMGREGAPRACFHCKSVMHLKANCPHLKGKSDDSKAKSEDVILFTGNTQQELALLSYDAWNSAVLDSACSSTVCGESWITDFLNQLDSESSGKVRKGQSDKVFHFGGGEKLKSKYSITFPCQLAGETVCITTDVVDSDIPLLLSLSAMKKAKMVWNFADGIVEIFGKTVVLNTTSCGHHCVPILPAEVEVEKCFSVDDNRFSDHKKKLEKLHLQFAHPTREKFVALLKDAKCWTDEFNDIVDGIYEKCRTCDLFQKTPPRPVVAMPEAQEFGELLVMDLKVWRKTSYILHMIDAFSRFSISVILKRKTPQMVVNSFLTKWVGAEFGLCQKIKFDNDGEFSNAEMREVSN